MSGFEVFGVVSAAVPLVTSALPKFMYVIETLRDSASLKAESVETITSLSSELKVTFAILHQLGSQYPTFKWRDQRIAEEFTRLFEDVPDAVNRLTRECRELTRGSTIRFLVSRRKLEETVLELERQMQRLFRRMTLLVTYLQREIPSTSWAPAAKYSGNRPSKIQALLTAQFSQGNPRPIKDWDQTCMLYGNKYEVGSFYVVQSGPPDYSFVVVETCDFRGKESMRLGDLSAQEVLQKLSVDPPSDWLGILACQAAWWNHRGKRSSNLTILYRFPSMADPSKHPRTLRSVLRHADDPKDARRPNIPLHIRLRLAREIANAVLFVHVAGLVHKNIRPESILLFFPKHSPKGTLTADRMGKVFLTGFGESRGEDQGSLGGSSEHGNYSEYWDRGMYRHPSRVSSLRTKYTMLHDIYALGVTLLEVGVWQSFVGSVQEKTYNSSRHAETIRVRNPLWVFGGNIPETQSQMKKIFVTAAHQLLPFAMGEAYTEVVVSCLTCMDQKQNQVAVEGAKFIGEVLDRLDDIRM